MQRRHWVFATALVLSAGGIVSCGGGDDSASTPPALDAGKDGTTEGGLDGAAPDGDAADATATTEAGDAADAGPTYALFVGTDFANAELSVVALGSDAVAGNLALQDQDSIAAASGGLGFVLERSLGDVVSLNPAQPWTARATIDVNDTPDAGSYAANPHAVVVTTGTKAYVARYASNVVKIVDVASGASTGAIDLSAFVTQDDPDGLVDVTDGAYDATSKRAYFLLQRIDQLDFGPAPDFVGACLASHGVIVAIDTTTDAVVPLTDAGGGAIALLGDDPEGLTTDFAHGRILVAEGGCYSLPDGGADAGADAGPAARLGRGVESVDLASAASLWLYQTGDVNPLSSLVFADSTHAYVEVGGQWFPWNPTQPALGATAIDDFPQAPFSDGAGRIVGLRATEPDAGSDAGVAWSVVALSVATGNLSTLLASPFRDVVPASSFGGVTSALVR
jgi:hypothetical protein